MSRCITKTKKKQPFLIKKLDKNERGNNVKFYDLKLQLFHSFFKYALFITILTDISDI